jgi:hypothetical protein
MDLVSNDDPRRPGAGQDTLLGDGDVRRPIGSVEAAVRRSVEAAGLPASDEGAGALATACAKAVDVGNRRLDPYAVAAAARELREQLIRLRLDPASRDDGSGGDVEWFRRLMSGEVEVDGAGAG